MERSWGGKKTGGWKRKEHDDDEMPEGKQRCKK